MLSRFHWNVWLKVACRGSANLLRRCCVFWGKCGDDHSLIEGIPCSNKQYYGCHNYSRGKTRIPRICFEGTILQQQCTQWPLVHDRNAAAAGGSGWVAYICLLSMHYQYYPIFSRVSCRCCRIFSLSNRACFRHREPGNPADPHIASWAPVGRLIRERIEGTIGSMTNNSTQELPQVFTNVAGWKMGAPDRVRCISYWKWGYSSQLCDRLPEGKSGRCVAEPSASEFWFGLSAPTMLGGRARNLLIRDSRHQRR